MVTLLSYLCIMLRYQHMKRRRFRKMDTNTLVMLKQVALGLLVISAVLLVLTAIWYGSRVQSLTLSKVEVYGGQTISHERLSNLAFGKLQGEYIGFIPRAFAWLYPDDEITAALSSIDRIHSIEVDRANGSTLHVTFQEYLPAALWCKTLLAIECVFIDDSGYAYAPSPNLAGGSLLRFIHTSQTPEIDKPLTSREDFMLLNQITDMLLENGWFVSHIEIDKVRDAFLHIVDGGEFKVTLTQNPVVTVNNLNVVLTSEEFQDVQPGNFQYIDLRFGNKVFVNEVPTEEEVTAEELFESVDEEILTPEAESLTQEEIETTSVVDETNED